MDRGRITHLLSLRNQRVPCKRISVLATNQCADATELRVSHTQPMAVTATPRKLLEEGRDQLAMVDEDFSFLPDEDVRVV